MMFRRMEMFGDVWSGLKKCLELFGGCLGAGRCSKDVWEEFIDIEGNLQML